MKAFQLRVWLESEVSPVPWRGGLQALLLATSPRKVGRARGPLGLLCGALTAESSHSYGWRSSSQSQQITEPQ